MHSLNVMLWQWQCCMLNTFRFEENKTTEKRREPTLNNMHYAYSNAIPVCSSLSTAAADRVADNWVKLHVSLFKLILSTH